MITDTQSPAHRETSLSRHGEPLRKVRLTTRILDARWPTDAVGIVLPIPPTTTRQRTVGLLLPCCWEAGELQAVNAAQRALFLGLRPDLLERDYSMDILAADAAWTDQPHGAEGVQKGMRIRLVRLDDGRSFALSTGVDLEFDCDFGRFRLPHLAAPHWVLSNGDAKPCAVSVVAETS